MTLNCNDGSEGRLPEQYRSVLWTTTHNNKLRIVGIGFRMFLQVFLN